MTIVQFRKTVWDYYRAEGRHTLPWRKTFVPYKVLVSEIMLQQTQVDRVIPYYRAWMKKYPTVHALARAPLSDILVSWQGLGYNRRAKLLHDAAKIVVAEYAGKVPASVPVLEQLPGIGPYTARAIAAFAYNQDTTFIETNVRTAVTHYFFTDRNDIPDAEVMAIVEQALPRGRAREWYAALMDYGAHLKRTGVRINAQRKGYTKQTVFEGSARQVRGAIVRSIAGKPATRSSLQALFQKNRVGQVNDQLQKLLAEGLIAKQGRVYRLP